MEVTDQELRERYESLETQELIELRDAGTITESALSVLEEVLESRSQEDTKEADTPFTREPVSTHSLGKVLAFVLAIPAIGSAVSFFILRDVNAGLQTEGMPDVSTLCQLVVGNATASAETEEFCAEIANIQMLGVGSLIAGIIGILIPVSYWLAAKVAGESRQLIAALLPVLVRASILLIAI